MEYRQRRPAPGHQAKKKRVFTPADAEPASQHYAGHSAAISRRYDGVPAHDGVIFRQGNDQIYVHNGPRPVIERASRTQQRQLPPPRKTDEIPVAPQKQRRRGRLHWLFFIGLALLVMVVGYVALNAFGNWWHTHTDDTTYGRPRTFQIDAVVGHNDSAVHPSHFLALNLNRHILIIEIPGGDPSRSVMYSAGVLVGDGQDLAPVTLSFSDVNGDGKPDMLVHVLDQTTTFTNNGTKFVPPSNVANGESNLPILEE